MSWLRKLFGQTESLDPHTPSPNEPVVPLPSPGDILCGEGRFRLGEEIGKGNYGSVFLAEPLDAPGLPEKVAVKLLSPLLTRRARTDTLCRELSGLLAVDAETIPTVYDWQLDGHHPFVAMQYFPKGALSQRLRAEGALSNDELIVLMSDLLDALSAAHRAALLHLDIKPGNVLVRDDGGFALGDFGTAHAAHFERRLRGSGRGSRGFQAPEQSQRGGALTLRTDLFGVGATVWSAATGINLATPRGMTMLARYAREPVVLPPIRETRPMIPARLDELVSSLLRRDPAERPADPGSVWAMLHAYSDDSIAALKGRGSRLPAERVAEVRAALIDPVWAHILDSIDSPDLRSFSAGSTLIEQGETSHHTFVLFEGKVAVHRDGQKLTELTREGAFIGEVATLVGGARTADVVAVTDSVALILDLMELERLVAEHPAVAFRLLYSLADRFYQDTGLQLDDALYIPSRAMKAAATA